MNKIFAVSPAPHLKKKHNVSWVMWQVVIALSPALIASVLLFGINALMLTLYGIVAAVGAETIIQKLRKVPLTASDGSAVVTGILVSFNIHANSPWWLPVVGAVFAIAIGKQVFGGLGNNPFNPALLARAFMVASWPTLTTAGWKAAWDKSLIAHGDKLMSGLNGDFVTELSSKAEMLVTNATPLAVVKALRDSTAFIQNDSELIISKLTHLDTINNLFIGYVGGVIGEVSALALLIGAVYLAWKHIIEWRIPVSYIGTVFVLVAIFGGLNGPSLLLATFHIFAGGLILGAFFMATDMVTSPVTKKGRLIFGIGCGLITVSIRLIGGYPEGVSYSILLMNMAVPLIDKYTMPK
ncbi:MAG: RnfABCDGE type electron transport complex subunit D, partial [Candidatus Cloacimonadota bacterium]|nr:RnfABCDGE type electron transport complex subunit D [Candidatus Cloacimonadota bacterium]